jgi:hypothetical protein
MRFIHYRSSRPYYNTRLNVTAEWLTLLLLEVPGSDLGADATILMIFVVYFRTYRQMPGLCLKLVRPLPSRLLPVLYTLNVIRRCTPGLASWSSCRSHVLLHSSFKCLLIVAMLSKNVHMKMKMEDSRQSGKKCLWREIGENTYFLKPEHY